MSLLPDLKEEIVGLVNDGNNVTIKSSDVKLTDPHITDPTVKTVISGEGITYLGSKKVSYDRRDISKFFLNIPLAFSIENLGESFTGADVVNLLLGRWPNVFATGDFLAADLSKVYQRDDMNKQFIQLNCDPDSLAWRGVLSVKFFIADKRVYIYAEDGTTIQSEAGEPLEAENSPS